MENQLISGVDFVHVATQDIDRAIEFYGTVLGLPESARYGDMPGVEFETGTLTLAVIQSEAFGLAFQADTHPIALHVDDVAAARSALQARGVRFHGDTIDSGVCHMATFSDPDGNVLMLHHRYAPRRGEGAERGSEAG
ncbi:MAG TPA: VOC family protein [Solirubrobacteraceae bacterium]|jgi:predicted enzyme related to lactoylglutathione lyase|nr:VOC family protein [Solirubrobacteraceae bacterium]